MLGHYQPASEMPFKWHFAGRTMVALFKWYLDPFSPHHLKKMSSVGPPLTKMNQVKYQLVDINLYLHTVCKALDLNSSL